MSTSIPHPPRRIPILGDVLGPIYRRTILGTDLTFVGSAELAAQVFDEAVWEKHIGRPLEQLRPFVGDGLFTAYSWESNWAKAHEALLPGFTRWPS